MQRTIYVKNKQLWLASQRAAKALGMSHSDYIQSALALMSKYKVASKHTVVLTFELKT